MKRQARKDKHGKTVLGITVLVGLGNIGNDTFSWYVFGQRGSFGVGNCKLHFMDAFMNEMTDNGAAEQLNSARDLLFKQFHERLNIRA